MDNSEAARRNGRSLTKKADVPAVPAANKKGKSGKQQLDANTTLPKAAKLAAIVLFERKPLSFCLSSVAGSIGSLALAIGAYRCITVAFAESLFFRQSYDQAANLVRAVSIVASFAKAATKGAQSPFQQLQSPNLFAQFTQYAQNPRSISGHGLRPTRSIHDTLRWLSCCVLLRRPGLTVTLRAV